MFPGFPDDAPDADEDIKETSPKKGGRDPKLGNPKLGLTDEDAELRGAP